MSAAQQGRKNNEINEQTNTQEDCNWEYYRIHEVSGVDPSIEASVINNKMIKRVNENVSQEHYVEISSLFYTRIHKHGKSCKTIVK